MSHRLDVDDHTNKHKDFGSTGTADATVAQCGGRVPSTGG